MKKLLFLFMLIATSAFSQQAPNTAVTPLPSIAQTATTVNSPDQINTGWRGGHFIVNVSAYTGGNYTPHIQGKDPVSGTYYDILIGPAISATGATVLKVYPGIGTVANGSASDILPQTWRVQLVGASTPSMTISVGGNMGY